MMRMLRFSSVVFSIFIAIGIPLILTWGTPDLKVFLNAANGDLSRYYYAPWGIHFFELIAPLSFRAAHIVLGITNVVGLGFATWVFDGSILVIMTSYAMTFSLFYGQPDGLWALGLGMMALGAKRKLSILLAIGFFIALAKYYIGLPLGIGILWCYANRRTAFRGVLITFILFLASLVIYGFWPIGVLDRINTISPTTEFTIDLWTHLGPLVLLFWLPVFITRSKSYVLWTATWALTVPYLYPHGLTHVLVATGPIGVIGHIGYLLGFGQQLIWLQVMPLVVYIAAWPQLQSKVSIMISRIKRPRTSLFDPSKKSVFS